MGLRLKILTIFGTRPEAIKLFPLLHAWRDDRRFVSRICASGQHRELVDQVLGLVDILPDYDLRLMRPGQSLNIFASRMIDAVDPIFLAEKPDLAVVQGDTTTALCAAIAAHHHQIPVAHVEAGLRSGDLSHPWPEEFNRKAIASLARYHFAPTASARDALLAENVPAERIHVTGNTVIDALHWMRDRLAREPTLAGRMRSLERQAAGKRIIGVTCHRRESFDGGIVRIAEALRALAWREDVMIVFPVHPNPKVLDPMKALLGECARIRLVEPLDYPDFVRLMEVSHIVLSDSGGVQEEAPALGTPVLVLRETTERPEGLTAGSAKLVGTDPARIVREASQLLDDPFAHRLMAKARNPYGDGKAVSRIVRVVGQQDRTRDERQAS